MRKLFWLVFGVGWVIGGAIFCNYSPSYGGAACASTPPYCPEGFVCESGRCLPEWPPADGADAVDGESDGATDDVVDGGDADAEPNDEQWPIDADAGENDAGPDGADAGDDANVDETDGGPCGRECPPGSFCNENTHTCQPCNNLEHCGNDCLACQDGETCEEFYSTWCCRGACNAASICQTIACGAGGWICSLFFGPERLQWAENNPSATFYCTLAIAPSPGKSLPIESTYQCSGDELRFFCTYDGMCEAGACVPNSLVDRRHDCGSSFGCDPATNRCRLHFKNDMNCKYNYDCQSFCCSRTQNSKCITANADRSNCKVYTTEYWSDGNYTWVAYNESNPHDISSWYSRRNHNGDPCQYNYDCDSGNCNEGSKRCNFPNCMGYDPENPHIYQYYFCGASGDHPTTNEYIPTVTNGDPIPLDEDCPDRQ